MLQIQCDLANMYQYRFSFQNLVYMDPTRLKPGVKIILQESDKTICAFFIKR